jgi:2-keto-3-deoxy-L-rhamnonate aldolase RhmA
MYNTVKEKLQDGQRVVGGTIQSPDPDIYRAMAYAGFDFLWIEMQHSPMTYQDVARMIWAARGAPAIPFIRVPDATEGDIQKATDIGALGIIVPMVTSVAKVEAAVKFASYPPRGARSLGGGQYGALWGSDYRQTANENIMLVGMIESPEGVESADQIAAVDGLDVVFVAATDLGSFSGLKQGDADYEAMAARVRDQTLAAGRKVGGPYAWNDRDGYSFFQAPPAEVLVRRGAKALLAEATLGVAETEGSER